MVRKVKILIDCHVFDHGFQGTTSYIRGLYTEMIKNDAFEYYLIASHPEKLKKVFGTHNHVFYLKYKSKNKFVRLLFELPWVIKKNKIDFAHFQYIVPPIKLSKYIVNIHDLIFKEFPEQFPLFYRIEKGILFYLGAKNADVLLTISKYSESKIQQYFNVKKQLITPIAVDAIFYEEYNKAEVQTYVKDKFGIENYFIYVSRWEPRKNHQSLLKTFVEYKYYETYQLVLVGDVSIENKEFNTLYNQLDAAIKEKIILLSGIDFPNLIQLIRGARLSVYPSIGEGFGIPPLETIAAEIPTVCSNATALGEFTFLKEYSFEPFNLQQMKKAIDKALEYYPTEQFKNHIQHAYNWKNSAKILTDAIQNVLKK